MLSNSAVLELLMESCLIKNYVSEGLAKLQTIRNFTERVFMNNEIIIIVMPLLGIKGGKVPCVSKLSRRVRSLSK